MTASENTATDIGGRHRTTASDDAAAFAVPQHYPWVRTPGGWLRQSDLSLAVVTDGHAWSVTSVRCGNASGQAPSHTDAMNTARAVLQVFHDYPIGAGWDDDEHHDDIWARSPTSSATPQAVNDV